MVCTELTGYFGPDKMSTMRKSPIEPRTGEVQRNVFCGAMVLA